MCKKIKYCLGCGSELRKKEIAYYDSTNGKPVYFLICPNYTSYKTSAIFGFFERENIHTKCYENAIVI